MISGAVTARSLSSYLRGRRGRPAESLSPWVAAPDAVPYGSPHDPSSSIRSPVPTLPSPSRSHRARIATITVLEHDGLLEILAEQRVRQFSQTITLKGALLITDHTNQLRRLAQRWLATQ